MTMILENNTQILWKKILITKHIRHWYWPQNSPYFIISVWVPRSTLAVWYILVREVRLWQLYTYKIHYWHRCIIKTMYRWIQELFFFFHLLLNFSLASGFPFMHGPHLPFFIFFILIIFNFFSSSSLFISSRSSMRPIFAEMRSSFCIWENEASMSSQSSSSSLWGGHKE